MWALTTPTRIAADKAARERLLFFSVAILAWAAAHMLLVRLSAPSFPAGYAACAGLALLAGVACAIHATPSRNPAGLRGVAGLGAVLLAGLGAYAWLVSAVWDTSPDGEGYHIEGVLALAAGWVPSLGPSGGSWRVDAWPNGHWAVEAGLYAVFGDVEAAKVMHLAYALAAGMAAAAAVAHLKGGLSRLDLASTALMAANPIVLTQFLTHYVDSIVYLLSVALLFGLYLTETPHRRAGCWMTVAAVILLINTKTAGLYYAGVLVIGLIIANLFRDRGRSFGPKLVRARAVVPALAAAAALVAVLVVGTRPYVVNWVEHRAVIYPDLSRIMATHRPANLEHASPPVELLYLIFGRTGGAWGEPAHLKVPGTFSLPELHGLSVDTRNGGFGPVFGLMWLLGLGAFAAGVATSGARKSVSADTLVPAGMVLWAMFISAVFPEAWWARYVPLVWPVPLLLLVAVPTVSLARRGVAVLALGCLLLAGVNAGLAFGDSLLNGMILTKRARAAIEAQIALGRPVTLLHRGVGGARTTWENRLTAIGIHPQFTTSDACGGPVRLSSAMSLCTGPPGGRVDREPGAR